MLDVSVRLRRAIYANDLVLVERIVNANPRKLRNPNFQEKGNTSLHLACQLGAVDIAPGRVNSLADLWCKKKFLVEAGHEADGISRNDDSNTPLMIAVESEAEIAEFLAQTFPRCISWKNNDGADSLMLASRAGSSQLVSTLLTLYSDPRTLLEATDNVGNTALHYASAHGHLKCIRTLLMAGASATARNSSSWTPISYSSTVAAEVYFKSLVAELERRRDADAEREREMGRRREGGLRIVDSREEGSEEEADDESVDEEKNVAEAVRAAMAVDSGRSTPTGMRREWMGLRGRGSSE